MLVLAASPLILVLWSSLKLVTLLSTVSGAACCASHFFYKVLDMVRHQSTMAYMLERCDYLSLVYSDTKVSQQQTSTSS